jgi:hypothetical protein
MPPATQTVLEQPECDVVLTRDHEYYVLRGICIAVRERVSGRYVRQDVSVGVASVHHGDIPRGVRMPAPREGFDVRERVRSMPRIGEWLCLERGGALHYVGPVIGCERRRMPSRRIVSAVIRRAHLD